MADNTILFPWLDAKTVIVACSMVAGFWGQWVLIGDSVTKHTAVQLRLETRMDAYYERLIEAEKKIGELKLRLDFYLEPARRSSAEPAPRGVN
jgi:hypothetical protein